MPVSHPVYQIMSTYYLILILFDQLPNLYVNDTYNFNLQLSNIEISNITYIYNSITLLTRYYNIYYTLYYSTT